jgi:hypothetical protein
MDDHGGEVDHPMQRAMHKRATWMETPFPLTKQLHV